MANLTKKAIQEAFIRLLEQRPLAKITVKDIVSECGINRNTFYYYFQDIPKLIEDIVEEDAEKIIQAYPTADGFEDCLEALLDSALSKKQAVLHIYRSVNRDIYELYLWKVCDHVINIYVETVTADRDIGDEHKTLAKKFLSSLAYGIFSNWMRRGMTDDIRSDLAQMSEIRKELTEEFIRRNSKK